VTTESDIQRKRAQFLAAMQRSLAKIDVKTEKSSEDKKEESATARRWSAETQSIVESNLDLRANRKLRWTYARWVFRYLVVYSAFVGFVLLIAGFRVITTFHLSDAVLEFLVGSTAISSIGLVATVVAGLFKKAK